MVHELVGARGFLDADDLARARKSLARVKHILRTVTEQWSVLATLTPSEYAEFRDVLGPASGFQSVQYRAVEFLLGNKNPQMLKVFEGNPAAHAFLADALESHTVYDAFLRLVARRGLAGAGCRPRARREPALGRAARAWCRCSARSTRTPPGYWDLYETSEDLVDVEDAFQLWRFRHLRTVQRTIGFKTGTGGSSGVAFLRRALDLTFFPELITVRTEIGAGNGRRVGDVPTECPGCRGNPGTGRRRSIAARAAELDAADPLASYRDAFVSTEEVVAYLDGNSLGRPLHATRERLARFVDGPWGDRLIRAWDEELDGRSDRARRHHRPESASVRRRARRSSPTRPRCCSTSWSGPPSTPRPRQSRAAPRSWSTPTTSRPTGSSSRGSPPSAASSCVWISPDPDAGVTADQVRAAVSDRTALVLLSHVAYRSGQIADLPAITAIAA